MQPNPAQGPQPVPPVASDAPAELGGYRLVELLGKGGMGEVWRAERSSASGIRRRAAVKRILSNYRNDHEVRERFVAEARTNARLEHPNVVQVLDFGDRPEPFLVLEYVEGITAADILRELANQGVKLPAAAAAFIIAEAATGLDHAHHRTDDDGAPLGIVHRDVSPQNILISTDGAVKVSDFGVARAVDNSFRTREGVSVGKLAYMAPEQARGAAVDARADVFSLGVTFWELLTISPLLPRNDPAAALRALTRCEFKMPSAVDPRIPTSLDDLVRPALSLDPAARFQTAGAFAQALRTFVHSVAPGFDGAQLKKILDKLVPAMTARVPRRQTPAVLPAANVAIPAAAAPRPAPAPSEPARPVPSTLALPAAAALAPIAPTIAASAASALAAPVPSQPRPVGASPTADPAPRPAASKRVQMEATFRPPIVAPAVPPTPSDPGFAGPSGSAMEFSLPGVGGRRDRSRRWKIVGIVAAGVLVGGGVVLAAMLHRGRDASGSAPGTASATSAAPARSSSAAPSPTTPAAPPPSTALTLPGLGAAGAAAAPVPPNEPVAPSPTTGASDASAGAAALGGSVGPSPTPDPAVAPAAPPPTMPTPTTPTPTPSAPTPSTASPTPLAPGPSTGPSPTTNAPPAQRPHRPPAGNNSPSFDPSTGWLQTPFGAVQPITGGPSQPAPGRASPAAQQAVIRALGGVRQQVRACLGIAPNASARVRLGVIYDGDRGSVERVTVEGDSSHDSQPCVEGAVREQVHDLPNVTGRVTVRHEFQYGPAR